MYNKDFILSTASSLEGYKVVEQYGIVFGETVFKHSFLSSLSASISNTIDSFSFKSKEMSGSVDLIEKARKYAYEKMIGQAKRRGANAIIAIDSDNTFGNDIMYISLYGTAVKVLSEAEYAQIIKNEAKKQEQLEKEEDRKRAAQAKRLAELNELTQIGEASIEKLFVEEISLKETYQEIIEVWKKYDLNTIYSDLNTILERRVRSEKVYGRSAKEVKAFIEELKVKFAN